MPYLNNLLALSLTFVALTLPGAAQTYDPCNEPLTNSAGLNRQHANDCESFKRSAEANANTQRRLAAARAASDARLAEMKRQSDEATQRWIDHNNEVAAEAHRKQDAQRAAQAVQTQQARDTILPKCKDPDMLATVKGLIERVRDRDDRAYYHVLKLYNVQAYAATDMGQVMGNLSNMFAHSMDDVGATMPSKYTTLPQCLVDVITDHGDQQWSYGWREIEGETFVNAKRVDD